ncbi:unnamed protein product [Sphagnum balticum]
MRRHSSMSPSPPVSDVWSAPRWLLIFIVCMLALNTLLLYRVYTSQHTHPPAHLDTTECDALLSRIAQQAQIDGGRCVCACAHLHTRIIVQWRRERRVGARVQS